MTEERNKRSFKSKILMLLGFLLLFTTIDHLLFKTKRIKTQKITITDPQIPKSFDDSKILIFSDVNDNVDQLKKVYAKVKKEQPDFIIHLGNLMSEDFEDKDLIEKYLHDMDAPYGKFTTFASEDIEHAKELNKLYYNAEFRVQNNSMNLVYKEKNESIRFVFLEPEEIYEKALKINTDKFNLGFTYDANQIDYNYPLHTLFSSNNKTNTINIPIIKQYLHEDTYLKKHEEVEGVHLRQTTGISSLENDFRLFSTPDIILLTLRSSE